MLTGNPLGACKVWLARSATLDSTLDCEVCTFVYIGMQAHPHFPVLFEGENHCHEMGECWAQYAEPTAETLPCTVVMLNPRVERVSPELYAAL